MRHGSRRPRVPGEATLIAIATGLLGFSVGIATATLIFYPFLTS